MLPVLIDHDFNQRILRGIMRRIPDLDVVIAHEEGLSEVPDPELLMWAAAVNRVIFTHDRSTMPKHAADLLNAGKRITGVIIVPQHWSIGRAINDLEEIIICTEASDWENVVCHLPL